MKKVFTFSVIFLSIVACKEEQLETNDLGIVDQMVKVFEEAKVLQSQGLSQEQVIDYLIFNLEPIVERDSGILRDFRDFKETLEGARTNCEGIKESIYIFGPDSATVYHEHCSGTISITVCQSNSTGWQCARYEY